jgi:uncharacterized membrane protein
MAIKNYKIEFQPSIPKQLSGLEVIADDLHYGMQKQGSYLQYWIVIYGGSANTAPSYFYDKYHNQK